MMHLSRTLSRTIHQIFVIIVPFLYLIMMGIVVWLFWMKEDRFFSLRMGNFFIQGRWESDAMLRNISDLRIDSRYGYFPLGESNAITLIDADGNEYHPEVVGYKEISAEEFLVELSQGLHMRFFSFEDGIAIDATQEEMPYEAKEIHINFEVNPNVSFLDDGMGMRLQLDAQNYAIEGDFEVSHFDIEKSQVVLRWMDDLGFDRIQVSSNLFGQPKTFSQWLEEVDELFSSERYDNVVQRYLGRALPYFQQRYNESNGLWRSNSNQDVFNILATLTRIWQAQAEQNENQLWLSMSEQNLYAHSEFPVWLTPRSGHLIPKWESSQRNFSAQERTWQNQSTNSALLFSSPMLYTEMAIAAPLQIARTTTQARTVQSSDSPAVIINKIYFLLHALTNQPSNDNLQAINRQLEAMEKHLVFLKKGIYILYDEALQLANMLDYAQLLQEMEQQEINITYLRSKPVGMMRQSLTMSALDFSNTNGEMPTYALWQDGRPQVGEEVIGLEYFYSLFYPRFALPQVHFASIGRDQRVLSVAKDVTIRTLSDTVLQLRVEHDRLETHYMVLTSLIRPVLGVSIDGRRLTASRDLEKTPEGYFYDSSQRLLYIKMQQKSDIATIRIDIEAPPPPPPKEPVGEENSTTPELDVESIVVPSLSTPPANDKKKKR